MKFHSLVLFFLFLVSAYLNAQTDFRPGYVLKNNKDTLYGDIDYRGDLIMRKNCRFRDAEDKIYEYSPNDIIGYRFTNSKFYVTREVNGKKIFLEYLVKGKISFFYMKDNEGEHYYIEKEDAKLTELPYEEGIKYVNDKPFYYTSKKHIWILDNYMQDAPELKPEIQSIEKPERKYLIQLAEDYHNSVCSDDNCIVFEKKLPIFQVSIEPFIGLVNVIGYKNFNYEIGGHLYLRSPKINEKLYFKTGISFFQLYDEGEKYNFFKFPIQVQYLFYTHSLQPFIGGGINFLNNRYDHYNHIGHTLNLNIGMNYKIMNINSLFWQFSTDFTPLSIALLNSDETFDILSYSFCVGWRFEL